MEGENFEKRSTEYEDRYRTLLEISHVIVSNLEVDCLFKTLAEQIKKVLPFDRAAIALYDPIADNSSIQFLDTRLSSLHLTRGMKIPHRGSAVGWVLDHQRYHLRSDLTKERPFFEDELYHKEGLASILNLPLIAKERILGTFNVGSKTPNRYSEMDIEFLSLVADQVAVAIDNARAHEEIKRLKSKLHSENIYLREEVKTEYNFEEIIGRSASFKMILKHVEDVAGTDSTVLITGETGTGKELIARAIHHLSKRKQRALIKVNCASIPAGLIESELFGHEKGAFTGAISRKTGRFELSDNGTIFLDEIGDFPQEAQAKLLRVLQEREFERIGSTETIKVNVRVIAATNRNLEKALTQKNFREDLYYRLNVFPIHLPPLRERKEDIPMLTRFFVNKYTIKMGKRIEKMDQRAMSRLMAYSWPGNIRELENIIERAIILCKGPLLEIKDGLIPTLNPPDREEKQPQILEEVERNHILKILEKTRWVIDGQKGAAKILNLHPSTLRSRMNKLNIQRAIHDIS